MKEKEDRVKDKMKERSKKKTLKTGQYKKPTNKVGIRDNQSV